MTVAAPVVCPSTKMAAFTAQTNATMVTIAANRAAHHGLALKRRTRMKTSTANGTAISEMRSWPGKPTTWSISAGNSGVRMPEMRPPAATMSRLREVPVEVIAWVKRALLVLRHASCLARQRPKLKATGEARAGPQIKAAPTRRLTRRWPFCCQVDQPRTGYAARRTSFNATLSFAFRFLTRERRYHAEHNSELHC